jgi:hypothetical protein
MDFTQAQIDVVKAAVATFPAGEWQAAILDYEIREMPDGFDSDFVGIVLMKAPGGGLVQEQFYLDRPAREACTKLYLQRKREAGDDIAGFVLRVEMPGHYRFDFKDKAKRLNGVWDAEGEQYLDNYLTHYEREKAAGGAR